MLAAFLSSSMVIGLFKCIIVSRAVEWSVASWSTLVKMLFPWSFSFHVCIFIRGNGVRFGAAYSFKSGVQSL